MGQVCSLSLTVYVWNSVFDCMSLLGEDEILNYNNYQFSLPIIWKIKNIYFILISGHVDEKFLKRVLDFLLQIIPNLNLAGKKNIYVPLFNWHYFCTFYQEYFKICFLVKYNFLIIVPGFWAIRFKILNLDNSTKSI